MNVTIFPPLLDKLDAAQAERSKAIVPRQVNTDSFYFTKTPDCLTIRYLPFGLPHGVRVEIVRVGSRFAIVDGGKHIATVTRKELWSALKEYRRDARWSREDRARAQDYQDEGMSIPFEP